jgi:hypothetical protein
MRPPAKDQREVDPPSRGGTYMNAQPFVQSEPGNESWQVPIFPDVPRGSLLCPHGAGGQYVECIVRYVAEIAVFGRSVNRGSEALS